LYINQSLSTGYPFLTHYLLQLHAVILQSSATLLFCPHSANVTVSIIQSCTMYFYCQNLINSYEFKIVVPKISGD